MALYTVNVPVSNALTNVTAVSVASADTIASADIVAGNGVLLRIITAGTVVNVTLSDPGTTALGNTGTLPSLAMPATGVRYFLVPPAAINPSTNVATVNYSTTTGCTVEVIR